MNSLTSKTIMQCLPFDKQIELRDKLIEKHPICYFCFTTTYESEYRNEWTYVIKKFDTNNRETILTWILNNFAQSMGENMAMFYSNASLVYQGGATYLQETCFPGSEKYLTPELLQQITLTSDNVNEWTEKIGKKMKEYYTDKLEEFSKDLLDYRSNGYKYINQYHIFTNFEDLKNRVVYMSF